MSIPEVVLPVFTVKSSWIRRNGTPEQTPYDRIVGIEVPSSDEVLWTPDKIDHDFNSGFNPDETEREELELTDDLANRLIGFFTKYLTDKNGERSTDYSCHRFAFNIRGGEPPCSDEGLFSAASIIEHGEIAKTPLGLGTHAVYGAAASPESGRLMAKPLHSVIGLGEASERCLQVSDYQGHLGLRTYRNIVDYYANKEINRTGRMTQEFDFYALQANQAAA